MPLVKTRKRIGFLRLGTALLMTSVLCLSATRVPSWTEAVRRFRAGTSAYMSEKWQDAQRELTAVAAVYPSSGVVQYGLAQAAARAGDAISALAALSRALSLGYHGFLQDDADLRSLHYAPEWPDLSRKYESAEKRWRASHADPNHIVIHTEDIRRFWLTWDRARPQAAAEWPALFITNYLNAGTEGLREYYLTKCREPENFTAAIQKRAEFYDAIRRATLRLDVDKSVIRDSFRKFKAMYSDAVFPDVYFVIGQLTSGGTSSLSGLLVGVEMSSAGPETPLGSLSAWEKAHVGYADRLPGLVAHELIHYQFKGSGDISLLSQVLQEGAADFVAARIAPVIPDKRREEYAKVHEAELWQRFYAEKDGTDLKNWMYGTPPIAGMPSDLGYWAGRRICESYYDRAPDKTAALREIVELRHPREIFAQSEFSR